MKKTAIKKKAKTKTEEIQEVGNSITVPTLPEPTELLNLTGTYYVSGEISTESLLPIQQDILLKHQLGPNYWDNEITIIVNNSPGGDLDATWALIDLLRMIRMDVRTIGTGACSSGAAMLIAAGTKGKRILTENAIMMFHRFSWGGHDKQHELVARRPIEDAIHNAMVNFLTKKSKFTKAKDVEEFLLRQKDTYLTAKQALKFGVVDKVIPSRR